MSIQEILPVAIALIIGIAIIAVLVSLVPHFKKREEAKVNTFLAQNTCNAILYLYGTSWKFKIDGKKSVILISFAKWTIPI